MRCYSLLRDFLTGALIRYLRHITDVFHPGVFVTDNLKTERRTWERYINASRLFVSIPVATNAGRSSSWEACTGWQVLSDEWGVYLHKSVIEQRPSSRSLKRVVDQVLHSAFPDVIPLYGSRVAQRGLR